MTSPLSKLFDQALAAHRAGDLPTAAERYQQILAQDARHAPALRLLGMIALAQDDAKAAIQLIRQSILVDPEQAEAHHNLGDALRRARRLDEAIAQYKHACVLRPDWPSAWGALGNVYFDLRKFSDAANAYRVVIKLQPNLALGHLNLSRALLELGDRAGALQSARNALSLDDHSPDHHNSLGNVLWADGKLDDALAAYDQALRLAPTHLLARLSRGKILFGNDRLDEAADAFRQAIAHHPKAARVHELLGRTLMRAGQEEQARAAFVRAAELDPDSAEFRFRKAAALGDKTITFVPPDLVRALFDEYAPSFDAQLVDRLRYSAPQVLLRVVQSTQPKLPLDILDLGCGTGLCGQAFKPLARRIVGVDLSQRMLDAARLRNVYEELINDDLLKLMARSSGEFDLLLAGDVLIYLGDLTGLFPAARAALRDGGLFAFSIESTDEPGFVLTQQQRFAHHPDYIRRLALAAGFELVMSEPFTIRKDRGKDVAGRAVLLAAGART